MWYQFFLENIHFAINLGASLMFFSVAWLYFDAWTGRRNLKDAIRWLGFLFLSISFLAVAVHIESAILPTPLISEDIRILLLGFLRIAGYGLLIIGLILDPLIPKPSHKSLKVIIPVGLVPVVYSIQFLFPIFAVIAGFLYLRRATVGLEDHIKPVALVFFILSISELLSLSSLFQTTENVSLFNIVASFGILWILQHIALLISVILLSRWAFSYLLKRFQSQLYIIFSLAILAIFLVTTVAFTALLLKQLEQDAISQLTSNVKVLGYAVDSKRGEAVSDAQVLAQNAQVIQQVQDRSLVPLFETSESFLLAKKMSFLTIVDANGQVLARGEDREHVKDSLSDDSLVRKALNGESVSSVTSKEGVVAPQISIRGASPIKSGDSIIGAVITGVAIDDAFVDNIKKTTGLEASIYGNNKISATTLTSPDGKSRLSGISEVNKNINSKVLGKAAGYSGAVTFANIAYFASYLPLKDVDNNPVGMLFVGKRQIGVLETAAKSIEFTFIISALLLVLSIIPALLISRYIARQLE